MVEASGMHVHDKEHHEYHHQQRFLDRVMFESFHTIRVIPSGVNRGLVKKLLIWIKNLSSATKSKYKCCARTVFKPMCFAALRIVAEGRRAQRSQYNEGVQGVQHKGHELVLDVVWL